MKLSLFRRTFPLLFLLFAPQILAQSPRQANDNRESTASISGRVTIDGKPAVNSMVALREFNREGEDWKKGAPGGADGQRFFARVRTDNDGRYRFMRLAEGAYSIHALSHAYASKETCRFGANCREVPLAGGEALENVDFTFVRGGVITGRVTDAEDRPVIASGLLCFRLNAKGEPEDDSNFGNDPVMHTDDRGVYRLYGLPAGRYIIGAGGERSSFRANPRLPATFHPDVSNRKQATVIEVEEAEVVEGIDIRVGHSRKTYEANGRVVDGDSGQSIPNTRLHCLGFNEYDRSSKVVPVITNDQGQFKITELISGRYALYLVKDYDVSGPYYSEGTRFVVNDGDVSGLELKAFRGSTVSGTVVAAGVTDPAIKSKLHQARLFVSFLGDRDPATANPGNLPGNVSKISADGAFRFNGVPPGKLMFVDLTPIDSGPGRIPFTFNRIERDGAPVSHVIEIGRGEQVENLRIFVDYANGSIRGQVKIVGGDLPQGWRLKVYASRIGASEKSGGFSMFQSGGRFIRVDESGRFLMEGLAPGEIEFAVTAVVSNNADGGERPSGAEAVRQRVTVNNDVATSVTINFGPTSRRQ
jgi:protocatechuate 3,4-dioxygenase beta subunit